MGTILELTHKDVQGLQESVGEGPAPGKCKYTLFVPTPAIFSPEDQRGFQMSSKEPRQPEKGMNPTHVTAWMDLEDVTPRV